MSTGHYETDVSVISARDAFERATMLHGANEAQELVDVAMLSNDTVLVDAIMLQAGRKGWVVERPSVSTDQPVAREWLTIDDAAEYIGVTERTIRKYISQGTLPASRIKGSRLVRIDRPDLDALFVPIEPNEIEVHDG